MARTFKVKKTGKIHVISDEMPPTRSMADGKWYTSKSAMRRSYRASGNPQGLNYDEVGNDPARFREKPRPGPDRKAIHEAIERAKARHGR
jgi:hypothetical protein